MKHFFYLLLAITFLASCGDSNDKQEPEVFISDDAVAQEALKKTWIVQEIVYKTNFSAFDKSMNDASKLTIKQNTLSMTFEYNVSKNADMVKTEMAPKNGSLGMGEAKYYTVNKDLITVTESDNTYSLYTFRVSERSLIMETIITKDNLVEALRREGSSENYIDVFVKTLPSNFSGTETTYLKKKK